MCATAPAVVSELRRLCSKDNIRGLGMSPGMCPWAAQALSELIGLQAERASGQVPTETKLCVHMAAAMQSRAMQLLPWLPAFAPKRLPRALLGLEAGSCRVLDLRWWLPPFKLQRACSRRRCLVGGV